MTPVALFALAVALPLLVVAVVYGGAVLVGVAPDFALIVLTLPLLALLLYALSVVETKTERERDLPDSLWKRLASFARGGDGGPDIEARDRMDPEERQRIARQILVFSVAGLLWTFGVAYGF
ncbi:hypothetical protein [Salarchaeum japonicum]|uniref:DUF3899 domain-containing protein n=1 Tax=Salarchaeum japonicum TaxID=555573 RepID=A0AAV3T000_9EURY|nr:hypothetical protein [Salarchaeum japonicum]